MSNKNDMKTEVIIPGNEKNDKSFLIFELKVHNPRIIILLICINDVQGKERLLLHLRVTKYAE